MKGEAYREIVRNHLRTAYLLTDEKIESVLPAFLDTLLIHMKRLEKHLEGGDLEILGKSGHILKGALLNLGLLKLADMAHAIEQRCAQKDTTDELPAQVAMLKAEITSFTRKEPRSKQ